MTAIQQFWLVETPTILTSTPYPISVKDESVLTSSVAVSAAGYFTPLFTDSTVLGSLVTVLSGSLSTTAQTLSITDSTVTGSVSLAAGSLVTTAQFYTAQEPPLTSTISLVAGSLEVTAQFYQVLTESGVQSSVTITGGS